MEYANVNEKKIKHLEFIQTIIARMNSNSFVIKGWVITIVSAVLALLATTHNQSFIVITALPIIVFWIMDSFYLQTERKFVTLYEQLIKDHSSVPIFSLDISQSTIKDAKDNGFWDVLLSRSVLGFYLPLSIVAATCIFFIDVPAPKSDPVQVKLSSPDTIKVQSIEPEKTARPRDSSKRIGYYSQKN